jgi:hypothetical protein
VVIEVQAELLDRLMREFVALRELDARRNEAGA